MHIHILGICGTFMGSLAVLAKQLGHQVSGSDQNVYPPMSTQLEQQGISLCQGYAPEHLQPEPDLVIIGNAMVRGNAAVEYVLDRGMDYCSGPEWLSRHILKDRWVLAVAGTHGKTTTASMLTWILQWAGLKPGYLIGGVPKNFERSADLGEEPYFVVEADEYDSAFFDKRSKFVHYRPRTAILGNLEFDHGDIFPDLAAIQTQFHHLIRTIPASGRIISPYANQNLQSVFQQGVWSEQEFFSLQAEGGEDCWQVQALDEKGSHFRVCFQGHEAEIRWTLLGRHNMQNAVAAMAAARHAGVALADSAKALSEFTGVKRRLELIADVKGIEVYDDFAHHPSAIQTTLQGMRARLSQEGDPGRLVAVLEARSNTMRMKVHQAALGSALGEADLIYWYTGSETELDVDAIARDSGAVFHACQSVDQILESLAVELRSGDKVLIMSNGGFGGIHQGLTEVLNS